MTGMQALYARTGLGVVVAAAGLATLAFERVQRCSQTMFDRAAVAAMAVSRLGVFALVFGVLRIAPRGDVPGFYYPQALAVLRGEMPARDFVSSYAPLHAYMDAAAVWLWHSPLALVLLAIVAELLLLPVWLRVARRMFSESAVRVAAVLYVASPLSVQFVAVDGQDNVVIALLLALAVYACWRARWVWSGAAVALSVALVKFLPLIFFPLYVMAAARRMRWLAGFAAVLLLGYGGFALAHVPVLASAVFEAQTRTASNLPYVLEALLGTGPAAGLETAVLLLALLGVCAVVAVRAKGAGESARMRLLVVGQVAMMLALLLFSRKSWPPYLLLALFPVCLMIGGGGRARVWVFQGFGVVAIVAHSVWATVFLQASALELHRLLWEGRPAAWTFAGLQCVLLAGYGWLLTMSLRWTKPRGEDTFEETSSLRLH